MATYWVRLVYYCPHAENPQVREWNNAKTALWDEGSNTITVVEKDNKFLLKVGGENEARLISFEMDNATKFMDNSMMMDELRSLCDRDRRIEAIKRYREFSGEGLKESKAFIDEHFPRDDEDIPF